jgi:small subunit ribosomal protein S21
MPRVQNTATESCKWQSERKEGDFVARVVVEDDETFESALRRFNKIVQGNRILVEVRNRRFFEKPSIINKRKRAAKLRKSRRSSMKFTGTE